MKTTKLLSLGLLLAGFFTAAAHADPINDKCPVTGKAVDAERTVDVSIQFCCGKCKTKFDDAPEKSFRKVSKSDEGKCPISGDDADASHTSTVTIGVCCGNCQGKVKADPKKYIADTKAKK